MLGQIQKSISKIFFLAAFFVVAHVRAEVGSLVHLVNFEQPKNTSPILQQKVDFEEKDKFYKTYLSKSDEKIEKMYIEQWQFHDKQVQYATGSWRYEHLSIGSLDYYDRAPYEGTVRSDFARTVFRMRLDSSLRALLYDVKSPGVKTAAAVYTNTVEKARNYPLRLSDDKDSKTGEFRVGYDVLSDSSKVEYVRGYVEAGVYHPQLFGFITRQRSWDIATLNISSNIPTAYPKATVSYPFNGKTIQGSLSKSLSPSVTASVVSSKPLKDQTAPHSYSAFVAYSF